MSKLRRQLSASTSNIVETKNLDDIKDKTGNFYESIAIIGKRANQINISLKKNCIISWKNLQVILIALKKFMKIKNRLKFQRHMKECLILHCLLHRNLWKIKFISVKMKMIFLVKYLIRVNNI